MMTRCASAYFLTAGQLLLFDVWGFGWVWVGLGHGSISSPGSGLGCVGSVIWWVGLGWVDENRPMDNSVLPHRGLIGMSYC